MHSRLAVLASCTLLVPAVAQESAALLEAPQVIAGATQRMTDVLDLDGDGFAEAVGWWFSNDQNQIWVNGWRNDGQGKLSGAWALTHGYSQNPAESLQSASGAADLDLDGRDDFVIAVGKTVSIWRSNGVYAVPTVVQTIVQPANVAALALQDFDGDGRRDLALLGVDVRIYVQNPVTGQFALSSTETTAPQTLRRSMTSGEVTGDATPDLIVTQMDHVVVYPVSGGAIGAPTVRTHGTFRFDEHVPFPTAGDIDGDGDVDVVVFGPDSYRVLRRSGPGSLVLEDASLGGPAEFLVDVDGDGDLDGACCGGGSGTGPRNILPSVFQIALNDGTGAFAPAFQLAGLGAQKLAGAVDLDHDGDVDLVAGRCVHYACGPLKATPTPELEPGNATVLQPREALDLDRDGDLDLRVRTSGMLKGRGNGTWAASAVHLPDPPAGMQWLGDGYPGDFDGDGATDLVVGMQTPGGTFVSMRLLVNTGGGAFVDGGDAAPAGVDFRPLTSDTIGARQSFAVDLDGDLDLDLVTRSAVAFPGQSKLWLNDGTGSFALGQDVAMGVHAVGNLNGDALLDLVGVGQPSWGIFAAAGTAPGAFAPAASLLDGGTLTMQNDQYEVSDMDGDGDLDVAVIWNTGWSNGTTTAHHYENDGTGSFAETVLSTQMERATAYHLVRAVDLDGDGLKDVVMGPVGNATNALAVRLQQPEGWAQELRYVVGHPLATSAGVPADVDGDGDLDLLFDRVIRNRTHEGPTAGHHVQLRGSWSADGMPVTFGGAGPFRFGELAQLRLRGAPPGKPGWFRAAYVDGEVGGLPLYHTTHWFPFVTSGDPDGLPGSGEWTLQYVVPGYKRGRTYSYSVFVTSDDGEVLVARPEPLRVRYGD